MIIKPRSIISACLLLMAAAFLPGCGESCPGGPTETVVIREIPFVLEVASTEESIQRGLGGRESIPENGGMIFVFPDPQPRRFWMKNCLVDIDIMFLDALGRITSIYTMQAEPLKDESESQTAYEARLKRYPSSFGAQYAIELRAGRIGELGLMPGNKVVIPVDCLKARLD